jgi:hypothetical protein
MRFILSPSLITILCRFSDEGMRHELDFQLSTILEHLANEKRKGLMHEKVCAVLPFIYVPPH